MTHRPLFAGAGRRNFSPRRALLGAGRDGRPERTGAVRSETMATRWRRLELAALAGSPVLTLGLAAGGGAARAQATPAELVGAWALVTLQAAGQPVEDTIVARISLTFEAGGRIS